MNKSSARLILEAKQACKAIAIGPFTPVIFERYEWINGEFGVRLGYGTETVDGKTCIVWKHSSLKDS